MFYLIAKWLEFEGIFNLFRYQTFRAGAAILTALFIGLLIGPKLIDVLRVRQGKGQPIREDGPQTHLAKRGTPTMGGLMILIAMVLSLLLWMDLTNPFVWACLAVTIGFGAIGFMDDYDKVTKNSHAGVSGKVRLALEFIVAGIAAYIIVSQINTWLYVPFVSDRAIPLGPLYYVFAAIVIVGAGNAVNLTDGLDGLAIMPVVIAAGTFAIIAFLVGQQPVAQPGPGALFEAIRQAEAGRNDEQGKQCRQDKPTDHDRAHRSAPRAVTRAQNA